MNLRIRTTERIDDSDGRKIFTYTPVLTGGPFASGEMTFSVWEEWVDATPEKKQRARDSALKNAMQVLTNFVISNTETF